MLLANDTHPPGLASLLAPIPRPAEPDFDTGAELRLLIGLDRRQAAPPPVAGLDLAIGIGTDWCDHSPEFPCLERLPPHAHVVRMLTATLHQPGLFCFDYFDLRDCVRACEGHAGYRHFAGSLNRFDELLDALVHPDLIPVWQRSRGLLLLISSGVGIMIDQYTAIGDALVTQVPETCRSAVATALYASRPETEDCNWVWVDVISGGENPIHETVRAGS